MTETYAEFLKRIAQHDDPRNELSPFDPRRFVPAEVVRAKPRKRSAIPKGSNKTYIAEDGVWKGKKAAKHNEPMSSHDIRILLDRFGLHEWTLKRVGSLGGVCRKHSKTITIGRLAPGWVVYHEMAHALADTHGHNAEFRREYIRVVREVLGDWWARRLEVAFRDAKLDVAA